MFCPLCGRVMAGPATASVPYPIYVCASDGIVFDLRRSLWHGLPEGPVKVCCPVCGTPMEREPKEPPHRLFFCYQCGTTYDRERSTWYGLAYHQPPAGPL